MRVVNEAFRFRKVTIEYESHTQIKYPTEKVMEEIGFVQTDSLLIRGVSPLAPSRLITQAMRYFYVSRQFKTLDYFDSYLPANDHPHNWGILPGFIKSMQRWDSLKQLVWDHELLLTPALTDTLLSYVKHLDSFRLKLLGPTRFE